MVYLHLPPSTPHIEGKSCKLFLAGTIDMGESYDWQSEIYHFIANKFNLCCVDIFNPRRPDWNKSWSQYPVHPILRRQIEWELECLERADIIALVLMSNSLSPISLMELGAFKDKQMLIFCPHDFWRRANVEVFVKKYKNPNIIIEDWDLYKIALKRLVEAYILKLS